MKIGIAHQYFRQQGGGSETTLRLIEALKKTDHHTTLYTIDKPPTSETPNFKICIIGLKKFPLFKGLQENKKLKKLFH